MPITKIDVADIMHCGRRYAGKRFPEIGSGKDYLLGAPKFGTKWDAPRVTYPRVVIDGTSSSLHDLKIKINHEGRYDPGNCIGEFVEAHTEKELKVNVSGAYHMYVEKGKALEQVSFLLNSSTAKMGPFFRISELGAVPSALDMLVESRGRHFTGGQGINNPTGLFRYSFETWLPFGKLNRGDEARWFLTITLRVPVIGQEAVPESRFSVPLPSLELAQLLGRLGKAAQPA